MESVEDVDEVFVNDLLENVLEKFKSGNRQGFVNKMFYIDFMDLIDDGVSILGEIVLEDVQEVINKIEVGVIFDKFKSGNRKGFLNKNFYIDFMDVLDDDVLDDSVCVLVDKVVEEVMSVIV